MCPTCRRPCFLGLDTEENWLTRRTAWLFCLTCKYRAVRAVETVRSDRV